MEEIIIQGGSFVASKIFDEVFAYCKDYAFHKWNSYRVKNFINQLVASMGNDEDIASEKFNKFFDNDKSRDFLLDSMRSSCFARSKEYGPKAIAILTAKIISENRAATNIEQDFIEIFEQLWDDEFEEMNEYLSGIKKDNQTINRSNEIEIELDKEVVDLSFHTNSKINVSPPHIIDCLGRWAAKFNNKALLKIELSEENNRYYADYEYVDEDGVQRTIKTVLFINVDILKMKNLIQNIFPVKEAN